MVPSLVGERESDELHRTFAKERLATTHSRPHIADEVPVAVSFERCLGQACGMRTGKPNSTK